MRSEEFSLSYLYLCLDINFWDYCTNDIVKISLEKNQVISILKQILGEQNHLLLLNWFIIHDLNNFQLNSIIAALSMLSIRYMSSSF